MGQSIYENVLLDLNLPMRIIHLDTQDKNAPYAHLLDYSDINTTHFIPPHWHRSIEMTYVKKGGMTLRLGTQSYEYFEGEFLFVNSGDIHEISNIPGMETEVICFIISYDYCKTMDPKFDMKRFDLSDLKPSKNELIHLFEDILELYYQESDYHYLIIRSKLDMILYHLYKDYQTESTDGRQIRQLINIQNTHKEVLAYIHDNYHEPLNLEGLSETFHVSREHFSRQFKEAFGRTFLEYLIDYRIFKAFEDIVNTNLTIEHISQVHGFPSSKGMITQFKKRYRTTPNEYRKNRDISIIDHKNQDLNPIILKKVNK